MIFIHGWLLCSNARWFCCWHCTLLNLVRHSDVKVMHQQKQWQNSYQMLSASSFTDIWNENSSRALLLHLTAVPISLHTVSTKNKWISHLAATLIRLSWMFYQSSFTFYYLTGFWMSICFDILLFVNDNNVSTKTCIQKFLCLFFIFFFF